MALVDKERVINVIYLDLCKAFDAVPLVSKLERRGASSERWVDKELAGWLQSKNCDQQLNIQAETSDTWHSSGVGTGMSAVQHLCW